MNKKTSLITIIIIIVIILIPIGLISCRPYDKPEIVTIEPSQTAFLVPYIGQTSNQTSFSSEEYLKQLKISTKQVQIPHRWIQQGRIPSNGKWIPSAKLLIVERKPITREWTESEKSGTSSKNEGIVAESKESIGFMARINCSAQIDESDTIRFLYRYNNKPLEEIMDTEIRSRIESKFVEECSKLTLEEILANKENIIKNVRNEAIPYFKERGININVIGLKGEFTYLNPEIQKSIDNRFQSSKTLETQRNENQRVLEKAKADAEAIKLQNETISQTIKLRELEIQGKAIEKWDGKMPQITGSNTSTILTDAFKLNK